MNPSNANPPTDQSQMEPTGPHRSRPTNPQARFKRTPVTFTLILATLLAFLGQLGSEAMLGFDLVGAIGAKDNAAIAAGQVWRLITPIFVHGGLLHFAVNMYSLYAIGPAVERFFGPWRTLTLYLLSGVSGVVFSLVFSTYRSVGASGAIFGLLGALGAFLYAHRSTFGQAGRMQLRQIILVAILNLGLGLSPGIDNWGHLGGLLFGTGLAWFIGPDLEIVQNEVLQMTYLVDRRPWRQTLPMILLGAALLVLLALLATLSQPSV